MKIIHTGDWHLGHRLYNYDRTDEEAYFFAQLASAVERERPDAMVVSGDVFHTGTPGNDVARAFTERLMGVQAACPSMETIVIAGNHDSGSRLAVDKELWRSCRVHVFGTPAAGEGGNADFAGSVVRIADKGVVAAVPFCHERNFPRVDGADGEKRAQEYFGGLSRYVKDAAGGLPAVLAAHMAVKADLDFRGHDKILAIGGEECVDAGELGSAYGYVALGHIHCPQWVNGRKNRVRYCGTPRAIHFDETYAHGVDVVTVEAGGSVELKTVEFKPLRSLVTVGGDGGMAFGDALKALEGTPCAEGDYIRFNVRLEEGEPAGADWTERARLACGARGLRFCVNNMIRNVSGKKEGGERKVLTVTELRELSSDKVVDILASKRNLGGRQRELLKNLMEGEEA
ncbi:MAG: exonuclease SbcCD subunit D [Kiritimatiellae bacterium]|nr:exonuclease SbcCD subunit D [Kiritimatiellia bacterium]